MAKRAYMEANKRWLEEKAKEAGVKCLAKGVMYKVIKQGETGGASPSPQSIVTVHYTGRTIDGRQFDTSLGGVPLACRLCQLIEGWIIALQHNLRQVAFSSTTAYRHRQMRQKFRFYHFVHEKVCLSWFSSTKTINCPQSILHQKSRRTLFTVFEQ